MVGNTSSRSAVRTAATAACVGHPGVDIRSQSRPIRPLKLIYNYAAPGRGPGHSQRPGWQEMKAAYRWHAGRALVKTYFTAPRPTFELTTRRRSRRAHNLAGNPKSGRRAGAETRDREDGGGLGWSTPLQRGCASEFCSWTSSVPHSSVPSRFRSSRRSDDRFRLTAEWVYSATGVPVVCLSVVGQCAAGRAWRACRPWPTEASYHALSSWRFSSTRTGPENAAGPWH